MADISYTPTTWADGAEGGTPIDSTKLNNIESGIVDAVAAIGPNDTTEDGTLKAQIDAISFVNKWIASLTQVSFGTTIAQNAFGIKFYSENGNELDVWFETTRIHIEGTVGGVSINKAIPYQ